MNTSTKIESTMVNSNVKAYHERGRSGKHTMWWSKDLNVSIYLKKGLQRVVIVYILMGPNESKNQSTVEGKFKCLDQRDNRNEKGTCLVHEGLCSMKTDEATTTNCGGAKCE